MWSQLIEQLLVLRFMLAGFKLARTKVLQNLIRVLYISCFELAE